MKALYDYKPLNSVDTSVSITASPHLANFPPDNLKDPEPTKTFKTLNASGAKFILYDAGYGKKFTVNSLFLNRFNFASFQVLGSDDNFSTTPFIKTVSGCVRDEIYDPNTSQIVSDSYMSYWLDITGFNYRYLKLVIPEQTPIFETSYFKVGNMLIGNCVEIWNPKGGFSVTVIPNLNVVEFDSGYDSFYKKGKTYRIFEGEFDIKLAELEKIRLTVNPFALFFDWTLNNQTCYLVRNIREFKKTYNMADKLTRNLSLKEVV